MARWVPTVLDTLPHDAGAFTQGLLMWGGDIYESTGGYGSSTIRRMDYPEMLSISIIDLPDSIFAEGIAAMGDTLYMLTWREGLVLLYSLPGLEPLGVLAADGEGWGLASDSSVLFSSDGSSVVTVRDPSTFAPLRRFTVSMSGMPVALLNELEYRDGTLYANQWGTDLVFAFDPSDGRVQGIVDASGLLAPAERGRADVLNGIAFDQEGRMLLTGKYWPAVFAAEAPLDTL